MTSSGAARRGGEGTVGRRGVPSAGGDKLVEAGNGEGLPAHRHTHLLPQPRGQAKTAANLTHACTGSPDLPAMSTFRTSPRPAARPHGIAPGGLDPGEVCPPAADPAGPTRQLEPDGLHPREVGSLAPDPAGPPRGAPAADSFWGRRGRYRPDPEERESPWMDAPTSAAAARRRQPPPPPPADACE
ncbi:unnamed protein product [Urochloa humidicola]